jgi:hypothetical protein
MELNGGSCEYDKRRRIERRAERSAERQLVQRGDRADQLAFYNFTNINPEDKIINVSNQDNVTRQIATCKPIIRTNDDGLNRRQDQSVRAVAIKVNFH